MHYAIKLNHYIYEFGTERKISRNLLVLQLPDNTAYENIK